jgi:NCS1 family nucleobase:cation symporter-1
MGVKTKKVVHFLEAPNPRGLDDKQLFIENEDLKPVESARRLWKARNFATFWIADGL